MRQQFLKKDLLVISNYFLFMMSDRVWSIFFFPIWTSSCSSILSWKAFPVPIALLWCFFWKKSIDHISVSLFPGLSDLFVCPYAKIILWWLLWLYSKSRSVSPSIFLKIILAILDHLHFHIPLVSNGQFLQKHLVGVWMEFWFG